MSDLESNKKWNNNHIPFCGDNSSLLAINLKNENVVEWDEDDGFGNVCANSFENYLENYRNSLLGGHFEYVDGCGVMEKVSSAQKFHK